MSSGGKRSRVPEVPAPAPMPTDSSISVQEARSKSQREAMMARARGRSSTILTGNYPTAMNANPQNPANKTLLGQ